MRCDLNWILWLALDNWKLNIHILQNYKLSHFAIWNTNWKFWPAYLSFFFKSRLNNLTFLSRPNWKLHGKNKTLIIGLCQVPISSKLELFSLFSLSQFGQNFQNIFHFASAVCFAALKQSPKEFLTSSKTLHAIQLPLWEGRIFSRNLWK